MAGFRSLDDVEVTGRRVLVRADLNVPVHDGRVGDDTRIRHLVPTVGDLVRRGARVVLLSHFGRPDGRRVPAMSLAPVVPALEAVLGRKVAFAADCIGEAAAATVAALGDGDVALLENVRFHPGEEANDPAFVRELAALGDLYVNDAFSTAHRAHASTEGLAHVLPAVAGRGMQAELEALEAALGKPQRPVMAVIGGAKVSSKLDVLGHLIGKVDQLVIGGGMANTFLAARGIEVGSSLCEHDRLDEARAIEARAGGGGTEIVLPVDVVVAHELRPNVDISTIVVEKVPSDMKILDVGPRTVGDLERRLAGCRTLVWNGPLGAFETPPFEAGTMGLARAVAAATAAGTLLSVAGGGDTVAALNAAGVADRLSYVSTAGGAFLEWLEGRELRGVAALRA